MGIQNGSFRRKYELLVPFKGTNGTSRRNGKILPIVFGFRNDLSKFQIAVSIIFKVHVMTR